MKLKKQHHVYLHSLCINLPHVSDYRYTKSQETIQSQTLYTSAPTQC